MPGVTLSSLLTSPPPRRGKTSGRLAIEPSLAWLLAPLEVATFLDEIWAATHHHVRRHAADYFDNLLHGPSAVDELLQLFREAPTAVRLVRGKEKKSGFENYRLNDGSLDRGAVLDDFADGFTIVMDGVERYVRALATLAHSIEAELNFPIQVNAYATPPGSRGLVPHYDDHDVLILQIQGSKIWHLHDGVRIPPHDMLRPDKAVQADGLAPPTDLRMDVGDVLYLPRGLVHAADAESEPSVHLTVGVHAPTALTLAIGTLHALSFRDDRLNAQLPPRHLDDPDLQASLSALLRAAVGAVEDPSAIAAGLDALADVLARRGRCPPIGPASNAAAVDGHTLVRKHQPLYSRAKAVADGVLLQFAGVSISAGPDHEEAMRFLSKSVEPFRVGDLPGLRAEQQVELARSLLVSGFLVRLPDN